MGPAQCSHCNSTLVAWSYISGEGDMLFRGGSSIIVGDNVLQRAALVCPECDWPHKFPRHREGR